MSEFGSGKWKVEVEIWDAVVLTSKLEMKIEDDFEN